MRFRAFLPSSAVQYYGYKVDAMCHGPLHGINGTECDTQCCILSLRSSPLSPSLQKSMAILPIMLGLHDGASKRPGLAGVRPGCRTSQSITQTSEPSEPSSLVTAALATLKRADGPTTRGCKKMTNPFAYNQTNTTSPRAHAN
ncbi:hypothetical protein H9L39_01558 [Fusarium oxysporum f. sp. albedinis]|nr:hypothetical protein H9L39_01558 [Fusarium oxysporum f. sp. albedinis]